MVDDDKAIIKKQRAMITCLEELVRSYMDKNYHITGLLSHETTFSLSISGTFGKAELEALSKRVLLDAELLGDGKINRIKTDEQILEEVRQISPQEAEE